MSRRPALKNSPPRAQHKSVPEADLVRGAQSFLVTPQERGSANAGRLSHYHEARLLQVPDKPLSDDPSHHFSGVALALATIEPQREGERIGEVFGTCGFETVSRIRHRRSLARPREHNKNLSVPLDGFDSLLAWCLTGSFS